MPEASPSRRAIVLGASNVIRNIGVVADTAALAWGRPLELLIAAGHGRSYGQWNFVLGYSLPGIVQCGLWEALESRPHVPTAALVTDIGNDILYGAPVETILRWVETCLTRLSDRCERLVVSELPLASTARMTPLEFYLLRSIFFPRCRLSLEETLARSQALNQGLVELAQRYRAQSVQPCETWFGIDPIHIRRWQTCSAWQTLLGGWCESDDVLTARGSLLTWLRLRTRRAHQQRWFAWRQQQRQPVLVYPDGSSVSLY